MKIAILGLSITSSWGNGHATTFRSLVKGLNKRGHSVVFLERDMPWYAANRDLPEPDFCRVILYKSPEQLKTTYAAEVIQADVVIMGSYVPDGIEAGKWITAHASGIKAFYDIDTPVTLAKLRNGTCTYLSPELVPGFDIYLSFTGGRCLDIFEDEFGSPAARQFYCSVDPDMYYPLNSEKNWDLGYLGTYSEDRQYALNELLIEAAGKYDKGRFIVAGPQYPSFITWPQNVKRIDHMPPDLHVEFYNSQRFTLNITRLDMVKMGYSPSVRLFEAAACAVPVITDWWEGLDTLFTPGEEIFIARKCDDTLNYLENISERHRLRAGDGAREKVLKFHTGEQRAIEFEGYVNEARKRTFRLEPSGYNVI